MSSDTLPRSSITLMKMNSASLERLLGRQSIVGQLPLTGYGCLSDDSAYRDVGFIAPSPLSPVQR